MNETALMEVAGHVERTSEFIDGGTIRWRLLGASLFPLAFFGLLSILVTASALYEITTKLVLDRNTAQITAYADQLAIQGALKPGASLQNALEGMADTRPGVEQLLVVNSAGQVTSGLGEQLVDDGFVHDQQRLLSPLAPGRSVSTTSPVSQDQIILSSAPIPGTSDFLIMIQPWSFLLTPALNYQVLLVTLLLGGTLLSLMMLSISIGRIIQPITDLATAASRAVPGSIFHPLPERGPVEMRALIASFNRMVIQLAEQQGTLRQYAQKALLSQEEERQRLSHELHDGTVQDLVGLAQRLELCQVEMESDPPRARRRLEELRQLAQNTLAEVRQISNALRPSILQDLGLAAALRFLGHELQEAMPGVKIEYQLDDAVANGQRLQSDMELALFRVAQESLTNIRKHATEVTHVDIVLRFEQDGIHLEIEDNGQGTQEPNIAQLVSSGHLGYAGMYERARFFGGKLEVVSSPAGGTAVRMILPQ